MSQLFIYSFILSTQCSFSVFASLWLGINCVFMFDIVYVSFILYCWPRVSDYSHCCFHVQELGSLFILLYIHIHRKSSFPKRDKRHSKNNEFVMQMPSLKSMFFMYINIWRALFQNALSTNPKIDITMPINVKFKDHVLEKNSL